MTDQTNDTTSSEASDTDGKPDLNKALASWDGKVDSNSELAALRAQVVELTKEAGERSYQQTMSDVVIPTIKSDLNVDNDFVEFWVNKQADSNPELRKLWDARSEDPAKFTKALEDLAPEFKKYAESKNMTADKSLAAAVTSAKETDTSTPTLDDVDYGSLSDNEFEMKKQEVFRLAEAGKLS